MSAQVGEHEKIPEARVYVTSKSRKYNRRSTHQNKAFPFLRDAPVQGAVTGLRNGNFYPQLIPKKNMPEDDPAYSNFREIAIRFWAWYCALEGISITNDFARVLLLYFCFGHYQHKITENKVTKYVRKPIIHGIHYKLINGRARFMNKIDSCFSYFIELYGKNPTWDAFLDDDGVGSPPNLYFVAFEKGLRLMCKDKHSMGSNALKSREYWGTGVHIWRKREAYIALARTVRGDTPYKKWNCGLYHHYVDRTLYGDTFINRHSRMFEAKHFNNLLPDPPAWKQTVPKRKHKRTAKDGDNTVPKRFCKRLGCLVPY